MKISKNLFFLLVAFVFAVSCSDSGTATVDSNDGLVQNDGDLVSLDKNNTIDETTETITDADNQTTTEEKTEVENDAETKIDSDGEVQDADKMEEEGECKDGYMQLKISINNEEAGSVDVSPEGTLADDGTKTCYLKDSTVSLVVKPNDGYYFSNWDARDKDEVTGKAPNFSIKMATKNEEAKNVVLRAVFLANGEEPPAEVTCPSGKILLDIEIDNLQWGKMTLSPKGSEASDKSLRCYVSGDSVNINLVANDGYAWSGKWRGKGKSLVTGSYPDFKVSITPLEESPEKIKLKTAFIEK